jgi:hypothetical protein
VTLATGLPGAGTAIDDGGAASSSPLLPMGTTGAAVGVVGPAWTGWGCGTRTTPWSGASVGPADCAPVTKVTCGTVMVCVMVLTWPSVTVEVCTSVMVVQGTSSSEGCSGVSGVSGTGTFVGGAGVPVRVMVLGTSVQIPGFSGMKSAQIPAKYDSAWVISLVSLPQALTQEMTFLVNSELGQRHFASEFERHFEKESQVFMQRGRVSGQGASVLGGGGGGGGMIEVERVVVVRVGRVVDDAGSVVEVRVRGCSVVVDVEGLGISVVVGG